MAAEVVLTGPLFDGRAQAAVEAFADDVEQRTAEAVAEDARLTLDRATRHPTGYYRSRVRAERQAGGVVATDGGVVYGPWLEGVARRNKSTGFKGYRAFRLAQQRVEQRVEQIAEQAFPKHKRKME